MSVCTYRPIKSLDIKDINNRFDIIYRQVCFLASGGGSGGSISSVFGRTGAVTATSGDYTAAQITNSVSLTGTETLTNKTLTLPIITSISNGGTITIPSGAGTFATLGATQTLANKTLTSPSLTDPTANKINIATGANASIGTATLVAGTIVVSTTAVATNSVIFVSLNTPGGTLGISYAAPVASIVNATSFVINSVSAAGIVVTTDTSTINYIIFN